MYVQVVSIGRPVYKGRRVDKIKLLSSTVTSHFMQEDHMCFIICLDSEFTWPVEHSALCDIEDFPVDADQDSSVVASAVVFSQLLEVEVLLLEGRYRRWGRCRRS